MSKNNPGGSLGDEEFAMPNFTTYSQLEEYMLKNHGYESSNNLFFKEEIKGLQIAEVGCGHGYITPILAKYASFVTGFDVDAKALSHAKELKQKLNINNIDFQMFEDNLTSIQEYEPAISMDVIEHVPNPITYLREINNMLIKGGTLFIGTPNGLIARKNKCLIKMHNRFHIMEYSPNELQAFLNNTVFYVESFYSNYNVSGNGYDQLSTGRKIAIKFLCKVKLFELARKSLRKIRKSPKQTPQSGNSVSDWVINATTANQINAHNCDVIIIKAIKK